MLGKLEHGALELSKVQLQEHGAKRWVSRATRKAFARSYKVAPCSSSGQQHKISVVQSKLIHKPLMVPRYRFLQACYLSFF
jgi:hypothetical protein